MQYVEFTPAVVAWARGETLEVLFWGTMLILVGFALGSRFGGAARRNRRNKSNDDG